jgi:cyclic pyranopterin phosphate synthase
MRDQFEREIDYMRLSITDRCNLRCSYCMPDGIPALPHAEILTYEELLRVAAAAVRLGITKFKVTGGEPLVRKGCVDFLRRLKALPGVHSVTLTTNGVLLAQAAPQLAAMGLDGVNISLDTCDAGEFRAITGFDALGQVLAGIDACVAAGLRTKLNCVLLPGSEARWVRMARFAEARPIDVRFIEEMPIGHGVIVSKIQRENVPDVPDLQMALRAVWPDLHPVDETRGNGPAHYYASAALQGRIGMIDAVSHSFCATCNRVRLTSTGQLKPCLCYGESADLRAVLRANGGDPAQPEEKLIEPLLEAMRRAIYEKPRQHCFGDAAAITEHKGMSQIGG